MPAAAAPSAESVEPEVAELLSEAAFEALLSEAVAEVEDPLSVFEVELVLEIVESAPHMYIKATL